MEEQGERERGAWLLASSAVAACCRGGLWKVFVFLAVLFTIAALTAHIGPFSSASHFYWVDGIANFSLGLSQCTNPPSELPARCTVELPYWYQVRLALRKALGS